ncbi:hypothetical protein LLG95_11530 [bacterium]|nr:hypothetical protein [bacterium]
MVDEKNLADANFDEYGWHDCTIHSISLRNLPDSIECNLVLDIDYILEWFPIPGQVLEINGISTPVVGYEYEIAPAILEFFDVDKLHIDFRLRYESIQIYDIDREEITTDLQRQGGMKIYKWKIWLNSGIGEDFISFESKGFNLVLTKASVRIGQQRLDR